MLRSIVCKHFGHRVDRRRVWNDGIDFRTKCARCGHAMLRDHIRWREFDPDRDSEQNRGPHPSQARG